MSDPDDAQIKAEIDGIMSGVNSIMKKIDALTPEEESEAPEDRAENPDSPESKINRSTETRAPAGSGS
jgi:hypothetical protein